MTNDKRAEEIVRGLREHAKWAHASEWEWQIRLGHDLVSAADLIESQAAEIARLRAENESLAANGGKYMGIAEKRYEMYEEAIKRAEAAEIQLADEKVVSQSLRNAANGYKAQLSASQQRERAAVESLKRKCMDELAAVKCICDIETYLELGSAKHIKKTIDSWRGPEAGEGERDGN